MLGVPPIRMYLFHTSIDADKVMSSNLRSALRCKSNIPIDDLHGVQALFVPEARRYHLQSTRGSVVCLRVICSCQLSGFYSRSIPGEVTYSLDRHGLLLLEGRSQLLSRLVRKV
jgi:hypothetical protein